MSVKRTTRLSFKKDTSFVNVDIDNYKYVYEKHSYPVNTHTTLFWRSSDVHNVQTTLNRRPNNVLCLQGFFKNTTLFWRPSDVQTTLNRLPNNVFC